MSGTSNLQSAMRTSPCWLYPMKRCVAALANRVAAQERDCVQVSKVPLTGRFRATLPTERPWLGAVGCRGNVSPATIVGRLIADNH